MEKHIILVRQLMALAESTRFEGERASALAKAKETMERYSLTTADITGEQEAFLRPNTLDFDAVYHSGRISFETMMKIILEDTKTVRFRAWYQEVDDDE